MEKKKFKMYEAPTVEVVEMEASVSLLADSTEPDTSITEPSEGW